LIEDWQTAGATHISFNTMGAGFDTPGEHVNALQLIASNLQIQQVKGED
jgi:hypothetical protein